jgi:signal peptidase II
VLAWDAMRRRHVLVFVAVLLFSAGCDQATKQLAIDRLAGAAPISLAGDAVRFELAANPGGFLSLGARLPEAARRVVFVVAVPAALLVVCGLALRSRSLSALAAAGLGLVAGGGIGNWLDRVLDAGVVTDFVSVGVGGLRTGIFNVADVAVMAGVALLLLARPGDPPAPTT